MVWRRERGGCGASGLLSVAKPATTWVAWVRATVGTGRAFAEGSSDASRDAGEGEGEAVQGVEGAWTAARERGRGRGPLSASGAGGDAKGGGGGGAHSCLRRRPRPRSRGGGRALFFVGAKVDAPVPKRCTFSEGGRGGSSVLVWVAEIVHPAALRHARPDPLAQFPPWAPFDYPHACHAPVQGSESGGRGGSCARTFLGQRVHQSTAAGPLTSGPPCALGRAAAPFRARGGSS